jgi:carbon-monoxide dehydrogenase medium subunit
MKPAPFQYIAPSTLMEALDTMRQYGSDAKLLAGGQSLIPVMNFRLAQPAVIVDLNKISELGQLQAAPSGGLRIGAMVRQSQVERSDAIANYVPLLHEAMPHIAHTQIRNRGTIGGSLAHADPAAELPVVMVALQARFLLRNSGRERWVNAEDFFQTVFTTALEPEEILTDIDIPPLPHRYGYAFMEFARRHGDYAQAGVAVALSLDERGYCSWARLVFLNVGDTPMIAVQAARELIGQIPSTDLITDIALLATRNEIEPVGDIHASAEYRRHLAFVLCKRAIEKAVLRVKNGSSYE